VTDYKDKNVGALLRKGTSQRKLVRSEVDGSQAGYQVEHWDDRTDAVITPKTVQLKATVKKLGS
jgi:hypothetical protein